MPRAFQIADNIRPRSTRATPTTDANPLRNNAGPPPLPSQIRDVNFAYQRLVVALVGDFLDDAHKRTPQFSVSDLRERSDQFQSVGVCEKVRDVGGPRSLCVRRLSAAAAPNPELAQNSGGPGTKQAAGPGRMGAILVNQFGPVKFTPTSAPADGLQVNTQMIEGPNALVIFDGQLLLPYADEVASYVKTLRKPVDRIILSHAHTDHWAVFRF